MKQFSFIISLFFFSFSLSSHSFTIVLDAGSYSQTLLTQEALICSQALQQALAVTFPSVRILLSRTSEEQSDPLHVASFSNRIHADLHVSFNFFLEKDVTQIIQVYTHTPPPFLTPPHKSSALAFTPAHQAHEQYAKQSQFLAATFVEEAKNTGAISVPDARSLPLKTLQNIHAPSFLIEVGISKSKEWKSYFTQLLEGLRKAIAVAIKEKTGSHE